VLGVARADEAHRQVRCDLPGWRTLRSWTKSVSSASSVAVKRSPTLSAF
jgi:hypothetical protein